MDKARLFEPYLPEQDVDIPNLGSVRVRGLTRAEAMAVQRHAKDPEKQERVILAFAMVDPELTEAEVGQWQKARPAGEIQQLARVVEELSGMREGADKSSVQGAGVES